MLYSESKAAEAAKAETTAARIEEVRMMRSEDSSCCMRRDAEEVDAYKTLSVTAKPDRALPLPSPLPYYRVSQIPAHEKSKQTATSFICFLFIYRTGDVIIHDSWSNMPLQTGISTSPH